MSERNDVVAVGIGSAGSRITSYLSKEKLFIDKFAFISCDKNDLSFAGNNERILIETPVERKLTPQMVRGFALKHKQEIINCIKGYKAVFVISGLGGATGSGLAPYVASIAQELNSVPISIAVMPFEFERKMHFNAGIALRWLRKYSKGIIIVDNNNLLKESSEKPTLSDVYEQANTQVVRSLSSLFATSSERTIALGMNKLISTVANSYYTILGVSNSSSTDKAEEALAGAILSICKLAEAKETEHVIIALNCDKTLSASEVSTVVERMSTILNRPVETDYCVVNSGTSELQVSLVATGFKATKFNSYDPLGEIFGDNNLYEDMDFYVSEGLEKLDFFD